MLRWMFLMAAIALVGCDKQAPAPAATQSVSEKRLEIDAERLKLERQARAEQKRDSIGREHDAAVAKAKAAYEQDYAATTDMLNKGQISAKAAESRFESARSLLQMARKNADDDAIRRMKAD